MVADSSKVGRPILFFISYSHSDKERSISIEKLVRMAAELSLDQIGLVFPSDDQPEGSRQELISDTPPGNPSWLTQLYDLRERTIFDLDVNQIAARYIKDTGASFPLSLRDEEESPKTLDAIVARATEVIGDKDRALHWMGTPVRGLGFATPISLLGTPEGVERVTDVLGQMEHGVW